MNDRVVMNRNGQIALVMEFPVENGIALIVETGAFTSTILYDDEALNFLKHTELLGGLHE